MTPTALVLCSVALGALAGTGVTAAVFGARAAGRRRALAMNPELPEVATAILQNIDDFAVILDASLSPVYANPAARDDPKFTGEELRDPDFLRRARHVMTTGVPDLRVPDPHDHASTVQVLIMRVQARFLVVLVEDVGEEQRVNAMRRDFIANVSHELKTPIAAISLLSEAVREASDDPATVRSFAKTLTKESKRLADLSRDIIRLSEAQSAINPEDREEVAVRSLVRAEVEEHRAYAEQRGVRLVLTDDDDPGRATVVLGRPAALGVAVANLLSNAIEHSPEGGRVGVGLEAGKRSIVVTVTDQGEGIAPEHLPRIFERFYRVDNDRSRERGGTGLGLSIARHTVRAHGGDLDVWSQVGVGSSFTLTLPLVDTGAAKTSKRAKRLMKSRADKPAKAAKAKKAQRLAEAPVEAGEPPAEAGGAGSVDPSTRPAPSISEEAAS